MMKKIVFMGSVLLLLVIAMWRNIGNYYIESKSLSNSFNVHLPFLIIGAIAVGIIYLIFFRSAFPKGWENQSIGAQFGIIIVFLLLAFTLLRQGSVSLNLLLYPRSKETFVGIVTRKEIERGSKGGKFYYVHIQQANNLNVQKFEVSRKLFRKYNIGDTLKRELITGVFDIKYMNE